MEEEGWFASPSAIRKCLGATSCPIGRPSVLSHSQESVRGDAPPLSQGAARHGTAPSTILTRQLLPRPLQTWCSRKCYAVHLFTSVTVRLLLDILRPSSRIYGFVNLSKASKFISVLKKRRRSRSYNLKQVLQWPLCLKPAVFCFVFFEENKTKTNFPFFILKRSRVPPTGQGFLRPVYKQCVHSVNQSGWGGSSGGPNHHVLPTLRLSEMWL